MPINDHTCIIKCNNFFRVWKQSLGAEFQKGLVDATSQEKPKPVPKEESNVGSMLFFPRHPLSQKSGERGQGDKLPMSVLNVTWLYALILVLSFNTPNKSIFWYTSGSDKQRRLIYKHHKTGLLFIFDPSCTRLILKLTCTSL